MFNIFPHISGLENIAFANRPIWRSCSHHRCSSIQYRPVVMDSNPPQKFIGKPLIKIIRVIQNIGLSTSPNRNKITPENIGANIEKMAHEFPTICS